jgi:hypothetical protein
LSDFAANVFNSVPVSIHVMVLMAVGATVALAMSMYALRDLMCSWENIKLLKEERILPKAMNRDKAAELEINHRDLGTKIVDRAGVDIAIGFEAFLVAIGTYMAIEGANRKVFVVSNLLSGYVGNALPAVYGFCDIGWSINVWVRAHQQLCALSVYLQDDAPRKLLLFRARKVLEHAILTAVVCLVSGALSMVTPTQWWPYPVLLICGLVFLYGIWVYRSQIGYEWTSLIDTPPLDRDCLIEEICFLQRVEEALQIGSNSWLALELGDLSIPDLLQSVIRCNIFEHLCSQLLNKSCIVMLSSTRTCSRSSLASPVFCRASSSAPLPPFSAHSRESLM